MTQDTAELILIMMLLLCAGLRWPHRRTSGMTTNDVEGWLLLALTTATMLVVPVLDAVVPWLEFADLSFHDEAAWVGLALGTSALWLFSRAQGDVRQPADLQQVITVGIYRHLRHPMYTAMLLWALAQILLLQNWLAGPAAAVTFLLVYILRMPRREQRLLERYGYRYLEYMERTGGLLPRLPRRHDQR